MNIDASSKIVAVIGGGPAGLRAAEVISAAGIKVILFEAKRSVGRKFLVAGKGGFNITNIEKLDSFAGRYGGTKQPEDIWTKLLECFDNTQLREWAADLGSETFAAKSGRVYPKALKAAPLLRSWIKRLKGQGVNFQMNHRLTKIENSASPTCYFESPSGDTSVKVDALVLALGGGSWPITGSDGKWVRLLEEHGIEVENLISANCGWECDWSEDLLDKVEAQPLKNIVVSVGEKQVHGELMITRYGLEGGPLYALGPMIRSLSEPKIRIDFKPTFALNQLVAKMESARRDFLKEAQQRWKLSDAARAIIQERYGEPESAEELANWTKGCSIKLKEPRPIEEAISSAGGVCWSELDQHLMLKKLPSVFLAGEMIDWEAPTGGYLMQGCFATGTQVGDSVINWLK